MPTRVQITPEIITQLQAYRKRSRVGTRALLHNQPEKPEGLNAGIIDSWLNGRAKTACKEHLDYILQQWPQADKLRSGRVWITPEIREQLHAYRESSRIGPAALLSHKLEKPDGLRGCMGTSH